MKKLIICMCFACALLMGCKGKPELDANGIPDKIIIAMDGGGLENPGSLKKAMAPMCSYLSKSLGKPVEIYFTNDYTSTIEALHAKKVSIAYLSPFSYVIASKNHDITPLVVVGENGKPALYHSVIFANPATGITTIDQLKKNAKKLTLCFSEPASTSGHLVPSAFLILNNMNPDSAFKQTLFAGSHPAAILSVASGKVDIGCSTMEYGINLLIKRGLLKPGQLNILWQSDAIVSSPICIRNDINKDFVDKVKSLYLNAAKDDTAAFRGYIKLFRPNTQGLSYIPVDDSTYNGVRKIANGIKDLNQAK